LGHLSKSKGNLDEARSWYERSDRLDPLPGEAARELERLGFGASSFPSDATGESLDTLDLAAPAALIYLRLKGAFEFRRT
jgi:hypothetical protein